MKVERVIHRGWQEYQDNEKLQTTMRQLITVHSHQLYLRSILIWRILNNVV